jgi:hypothetical protein
VYIERERYQFVTNLDGCSSLKKPNRYVPMGMCSQLGVLLGPSGESPNFKPTPRPSKINKSVPKLPKQLLNEDKQSPGRHPVH